jgi:S-(hydroxymethyl)glutathione dehydrogenase/alcohol dehydrogenase
MLGHEGAGIVEQVGDAVTNVKVGDHVVLTTLANCGQCAACDRGRPTMCRQAVDHADQPFTANGGRIYQFANTSVFTDRTVVSETQAVVIPREVPFDVACLLGCAIVTGVGAVLNRAKVDVGDTVLVIGAGGIGQSVIQGARLAGAGRIVTVDTNSAKEDIARTLGTTDFIDASTLGDSRIVDRLKELVLPHGVDHAFECVGAPSLIRAAVDALDWNGQVILLGVPSADTEAEFPVAQLYHDKSILGCRYGTTRPHLDIPIYADMYLDGRLLLDEMVSKVYDLADFGTALEDLHAGRLNRGVLAVSQA